MLNVSVSELCVLSQSWPKRISNLNSVDRWDTYKIPPDIIPLDKISPGQNLLDSCKTDKVPPYTKPTRKGQGHMGFCVFLCAWYYLNQFLWVQGKLHRRSPRAVLSLVQGLTILLIDVVITAYVKRVIAHPSFHNVDYKTCEKLMDTMDQGDVIIRPSSKVSRSN